MNSERTPLVLLHAYPLNGGQWRDLRAAIDDRRVLAPSLPGFGGQTVSDPSLDSFANAVWREMDTAGIDRAVVVGLSMGGYVAFRMYSSRPERIVGLILADTRAGADTPEAREKRTAQAERVKSEGTGWLPEAFLPDALGATTHAERPEIVARVRAMVEGASPAGVANALLAMRDRPDSRPLLPGIGVPVLAIVGDEDSLTPVAEAEAIVSAVPDGQLAVIPGVGHLSNLEDPAAFEAEIRNFLSMLEAR